MQFLPGDIAACFSPDPVGRLISWMTASCAAPARLRWGPSHVAMLCDYQGDAAWVESTTLCTSPCLVRGLPTAGAQAHRPRDRINDYVSAGGRVDLYRLTPINTLSRAESALLSEILISHFIQAGIRYDLRGAMLSGTRLMHYSRLFPAANFNELFCSELVAAITMRLNRMNHRNPTRFHPARLMRELVVTGKYELVQTFDRPQ